MATTSMEERLAALETELAVLKKQMETEKTSTLAGERVTSVPWWEQIRGTFKDDPLFDEAMRLGREWRESQRPDYDEQDTEDKGHARTPA